MVEVGAGSGANFAHYPASVSEVVRDALRSWRREREARGAALAELRRLWSEGIASGENVALDATDIKRRARERLARRR